MKNFLFTLLFIAISSLVNGTNVQSVASTFAIHSGEKPEYLALSFANWFSQQAFSSEEKTKPILASYGIVLEQLLASMKYGKEEKAYELFVAQMNYFPQQKESFRLRLADFLSSHFDAIKNAWEKAHLSPSGFTLWLEYQDLSGKMALCAYSKDGVTMSGKWQIKNESGSFRWSDDGCFSNVKGKGKKIMPENSLQQQLFERMDSVEFQLNVKPGKALPVILRLPELKGFLPFIRNCYASKPSIEEGEKIYISWEVYGVKNVVVEPGLGIKDPLWQVLIAPEMNSAYQLSAENKFGKVSATIEIKVTRIYLKSASVTFFTLPNGDDKGTESEIIIDLRNVNQEIVSSMKCGIKENYPSDASYSPIYDFSISDDILRKSLIRGSIQIQLQGKKPDTWIFSPIIILNFTDGSQMALNQFEKQTLKTEGDAIVLWY